MSPNAARFLVALFGVPAFGRVLVPINFRLNRDEVALHHRALGRVGPARRPRVRGPRRRHPRRSTASCSAPGTDAELFGRTGTPQLASEDERATATINYTSGTTARPKGVQMTHRNLWLNAVTFGWHMGITDRDVLPAHAADVPLQRVGAAVRAHRHGRAPRHHPQDRRRGHPRSRSTARSVTFLAGAPAVVAATLDAAAARRERGEAIPGAGTVRMVVAGAPPPSKVIERVEAELGWEFMPDLRAHRDVTAAHREPRAARVRRARRRRAGPPPLTRRRARDRRADAGRRRGRAARPVQPRVRGLLGAARGDREGARRRLVPHRRRRRARRRVRRDLRPQEGRDHLGRRERQLDRGRGLPVPAPRRSPRPR